MSSPRDIVGLIRAHQWIKNIFVFAAPLFSRELEQPGQLTLALLAFAAFCFTSSGVYILNDLVDLERDRAHPRKRLRPLAAARIPIPQAIGILALFLGAAFALAVITLPLSVSAVLLSYVVANIVYALYGKYLVILDVAFIALGFVLRIMAGALATDTEPSFWLLLCTVNISLFLGFAKRRAELLSLGDQAVTHREVLEHYSPGFLDQMISIVTTTTLVCYILYTIDDRTVEYFGTRSLIITVPFVMYGIFRYLYLTYHRSEGGSPTRLLLMDPLFLINNVLWVLACIGIIYWNLDISAWID